MPKRRTFARHTSKPYRHCFERRFISRGAHGSVTRTSASLGGCGSSAWRQPGGGVQRLRMHVRVLMIHLRQRMLPGGLLGFRPGAPRARAALAGARAVAARWPRSGSWRAPAARRACGQASGRKSVSRRKCRRSDGSANRPRGGGAEAGRAGRGDRGSDDGSSSDAPQRFRLRLSPPMCAPPGRRCSCPFRRHSIPLRPVSSAAQIRPLSAARHSKLGGDGACPAYRSPVCRALE